ncbi:MAG: hypothetical protein RL398_774 [Planctomycetota bacterium]
MRALPALLLLSVSACAGFPIGAQERPAPFRIEAGEVQIPDLIDRCAVYLDRNILVSPNEIAGVVPVRLQRPIETDRDGCEELLAGMLTRSGHVLTVVDDKQGIYEVLNAMGPRGRELMGRAQQRTVEQVLARPRLKMPVTTTVSLQHINATIATNALRPFYASTGGMNVAGSLTLGNVGNAGSLLLSGLQDQVAQAIELVRRCDVPSPDEAQAATLEQRIVALEQRIAALERALQRPAK